MRFAKQIPSIPLNRNGARLAYKCVYMPTMTYPLPATYIPPERLDEIQGPAVRSFLSAMGIDAQTSRALVFGPKENGGFGLQHLATEQGVQQISELVKHIQSNTATGQLYKVTLEKVQLNAGISKPILQDVRHIPYVHGAGLIMSIRNFLRTQTANISITSAWTIPTSRKNDQHIMDVLLDGFERKLITAMELFQANQCRLHLKVTTVSEIATPSGRTLIPGVLEVDKRKFTQYSKTRLDWPTQTRPSASYRKTWKKLIKAQFTGEKPHRLKQPLGEWTTVENRDLQPHREWRAYVSPTRDSLYMQVDSNNSKEYVVYRQTQETRRFISYTPTTEKTPAPKEGSTPVSTYKQKQGQAGELSVENFIVPRLDRTITENHITDFKKALSQKAEWEKELFDVISPESGPHNAARHLQNETTPTYLVSDASQEPGGPASYCFVLANDFEELITGHGFARGQNQQMQSFRGEGYGILAGLRLLLALIEHYKITKLKSPPTILCDNLGFILRIKKNEKQTIKSPTQALMPDNDVVTAVLLTLEKIRTRTGEQLKLEHVKGHQDDDPNKPLDRKATLNVLCDKEAKAHLSTQSMKHRKYHVLEGTKVLVRINNNPITSNLQPALRQAALSQNLREYLESKYDWTTNTIDDIDWEVLHSALKTYNEDDQLRIQKFSSQLLPVNAKLYRIDNQRNRTCPACETEKESCEHLLECEHPSRDQIWDQLNSDLGKFHKKHKTDPVLKEILSKNKLAIRFDTRPEDQDVPEDYEQLYSTQSAIGWRQLFYGRVTIDWKDRQGRYYYNDPANTPKGMDGKKWAVKLVKLFWNHFLQLWKLRNEQHHKTATQRYSESETQLYKKRIRRLYANKDQLATFDQNLLFSTPCEEVLKYKLPMMKKWCETTKQHFQKMKEKKDRNDKNKQQDIRNFFQPRTSIARKSTREPPRRDVSTLQPP